MVRLPYSEKIVTLQSWPGRKAIQVWTTEIILAQREDFCQLRRKNEVSGLLTAEQSDGIAHLVGLGVRRLGLYLSQAIGSPSDLEQVN